MKSYFRFLIICIGFCSCGEHEQIARNISVEEVSDNEDVREFMNSFNSLGIMSDSSHNSSPEEALRKFDIADDLAIEVVLSEPQIHQPVDISFDHRGRLWVVQYNQYPYPEGLKVTEIDRHNRAVFDKALAPPTGAIEGADKITVFEDTNGDGTFDKSTDAINGLNITTGVVLGRQKIWVLTPPYLVAYPDDDGDGIPEGKPEVHLQGFGLEDTHAVANNLRWGPDGWLYGAQGSTCIANISSEVSKNVYFSGQGIWRYHPKTKIFEIFAEGGGNTFDVEFDKKGRLYSGDNGTARGFYYKQGGYYQKNWGKHGALTNPYAFGYLPGMELDGERFRFTHAWIKYEESALPERYHGKILAINPLHNFVRMTRVEPKGSTFLCIDEEKIVTSRDHWFRPVDIKSGPDGAVYLADWNDSRMSHVDPRDTWSKTTGRIYRFGNKEKSIRKSFDLSKMSTSELIPLLSDNNKWYRQETLRQLGDRKDPNAIHELLELFRTTKNEQIALEALWGIQISGGLSDDIILEAMKHSDPYVRLWALRFVGDEKKASKVVAKNLAELALRETHLETLGQLASTAKRLPIQSAIPIIHGLLRNDANQEDKENQFFTWWAVESKAEIGREELLKIFADQEIWAKPIVKNIILERLMQRYAIKGDETNYKVCQQLFEYAPSDNYSKILLTGFKEGSRGRNLYDIPNELTQIIQNLESKFGSGKLSFALRRQDANAIDQALELLPNQSADRLERLAYIEIFGQINEPNSVPVLLQIAEDHKYSIAIRKASIAALRHYNDELIGERMAEAYNFKLRADLDLRQEAFQLFASRATWAKAFIAKIINTKDVKKKEVPLDIVRQFKLLGDDTLSSIVDELWPNVRIVSSEEKMQEINRVQNALSKGRGDLKNGKKLYKSFCANCHILNEEGSEIGPELTGYDRNNLTNLILNIVDPNADIREGYVNYRIKRKDGGTVIGVLIDRTKDKIIIRPLGAEEIVLTPDQIETMEAQSSSIMPERLLESLSDQELSDLMAYIQD